MFRLIITILLQAIIVEHAFANTLNLTNSAPTALPIVFNQLDAKPMPPMLTVAQDAKPIIVERFSIRSTISGLFAQNEIEIDLYNPNRQTLAAWLNMPLPDDAVVHGLYLDINGEMRAASMVEKQQARQAFESTTRRGIDPALLEKKAANVFSLRVFPIVGEGRRKIKIATISKLSATKNHYLYTLPIVAGDRIKDFQLELNLLNQQPVTASKFSQQPQWQHLTTAKWQQSNFSPQRALQIKIPISRREKVNYAFNERGELNFAFSLDSLEAKKHNSIGTDINLIWDASASRQDANHDLEFKLLEQLFKRQQQLIVHLSILRHNLETVTSFKIEAGKWQQLKKVLSNINYDGASNLSAINKLDNLKLPTLLFSDVVHSFNQQQPIKTQAPLYIVNTAVIANPTLAKQIVTGKRQAYFKLQQKEQIGAFLDAMTHENWYLCNIDLLTKELIIDSALPVLTAKGSNNYIYGRLFSDSATVELNYCSSLNRIKLKQLKLQRPAQIGTNSAISKLAAVAKIADLSSANGEHKQQIIALSKKHNLVSDFTSLLVLENLEQYLEYKIAPHPSLTKMHAAYHAQIAARSKKENRQQKQHLKQLAADWKQRKKWWRLDKFPKKISQPPAVTLRGIDEMALSAPSMSANVEGLSLEEGEVDYRAQALAAPQYSMSAKSATDAAKAANAPSFKLQAWQPHKQYLTELRRVKKSEREQKYYQLKQDYRYSPAFYFDVATWFYENKQAEFALQVLSNIAELPIKDARLQRMLGHSLLKHGHIELSIAVFELIYQNFSEEPQSYRDLALALVKRATTTKNKADYQRAAKLLYRVVTTKWQRFAPINITALTELNQLLAQAKRQQIKLDTDFISPAFIDNMPVDLRIVLDWDTDLTDIDLWVIEPTLEVVKYSNKLSAIGGMYHADYTEGYGPEEYMLRRAKNGNYEVKVKFYANRSVSAFGNTTLYLRVYSNYGRANQQHKTIALRLEKANDEYYVGSFKW